jgi:hypothetical protein
MENGSLHRATSLLIRAGRVRTLEVGDAGTATAVLVRAGRVAAVGGYPELRAAAPEAELLDLPGTTITPGLTDAHVHLTEWAVTRSHVELGAAESPRAAVDLVAGSRYTRGNWVRGRGWNAHRWNGAPPHRAALDDVFPDQPVALQSHDMHALWVNSAALAAAGIDAGTADPPGGSIVRDEQGEPSGLLLERAGELVIAQLPLPSLAEVVAAVRDAQSELHAFGITGVHSFPGISLPDPDHRGVLLALVAEGELRLRVLHQIARDRLDDAVADGLRSGSGDAWLRVGGLKLFLDGALGSRTAWLREPYENSASRGVNVLPREEFQDLVSTAARAGIACAVHAIGDAAVMLALDVLANPATRVAALPHRIEHVQCCPADRFAAAGATGIVCSVQPCHLITDWRAADAHWGAQRARETYAFAALAAGGATLAFGSDAPVEPIDPRRGLYAAVARQDLTGEPRGGWYPEHRLDAATALRAFTAGPALAAGVASEQGRIAPGAWADLVAWDRDPLTCVPEELLQMRCLATLIAGERVYG